MWWLTCKLFCISFFQDEENAGDFEEEDLVAKAEEDFFQMINADKKKRDKLKEKMKEEEDNKQTDVSFWYLLNLKEMCHFVIHSYISFPSPFFSKKFEFCINRSL